MSEDIAKVAEEGAGAKVVPAKPEEPRIGVFICHCGLNIAGSVDVKEVTKFAATLPNVVYADDNRYTCSDPGQDLIKKAIKEHSLNRVVVASCSPRMHEPTFRTACEEAGLNKYLFEMANIRDQCSWVHLYEKEKGTEKAKDLVSMAVAKAALLAPAKELEIPIIRKALVVGGGVAGIQAAQDLGDAGFKTYIVEKEPSIGGRMAQIDKTFPTVDCSICILGPKMSDAGRHPNIELLTYSEITDVKGYIGNFTVTVKRRPRYVSEDLCNGCAECINVCPVEVPNEFDDNIAPSIEKVPEPHKGSIKGSPASYPASIKAADAIVSRIGALVLYFLIPLLWRSSPLLSRDIRKLSSLILTKRCCLELSIFSAIFPAIFPAWQPCRLLNLLVMHFLKHSATAFL